MTDTAVYYPVIPPRVPGETNDEYTDRLLLSPPYNHRRNRQCSIGWHSECSRRVNGSAIGADGDCQCPHHTDPRLLAALPHIVSFALHVAGGRESLGHEQIAQIKAESVDATIDALSAADQAQLDPNRAIR